MVVRKAVPGDTSRCFELPSRPYRAQGPFGCVPIEERRRRRLQNPTEAGEHRTLPRRHLRTELRRPRQEGEHQPRATGAPPYQDASRSRARQNGQRLSKTRSASGDVTTSSPAQRRAARAASAQPGPVVAIRAAPGQSRERLRVGLQTKRLRVSCRRRRERRVRWCGEEGASALGLACERVTEIIDKSSAITANLVSEGAELHVIGRPQQTSDDVRGARERAVTPTA